MLRENKKPIAKVETNSNRLNSCCQKNNMEYYSIKKQRCIVYVFGGVRKERELELERLKREYKSYMNISSPRKNKKVLDFIEEHTGKAVVVCLYRKNGYEEFFR